MRRFPYALLAFAVELLCLTSVACGGSVTTIGDNDGASSGGDGGGAPDAVVIHEAAPPEDVIKPKDVATGPDIGMPSSTYPAPHPAMPQVISGGGPTVSSPIYIPVFFPGDDSTTDSQLTDFTNNIGQSTYWSTIVSQYSVGAATGGTAVTLGSSDVPSSMNLADSDIQSWLETETTSGALAGMNSSNTIFVLYFTSGYTITLPVQGGTGTSCQDFGGYHNSTSGSGGNIVYAVVPRCGEFETGGGQPLTGLSAITGPASHEFIEAATDPLPETNEPAYVEPDQNDIIWEFVVGGGEIMDMCAQFPSAFYQPSDLAYIVQRGWSNSAAAAGHDPCQPELPGEVYFNSVAVLPNTLIDVGGQSFTTNALSLSVGKSQTVPVDLYSEAATGGPWTVQALDAQTLQGGPAALSFTWDATSGENGQVLHLTVTANSMPSQGIDAFIILSQLGSQASLWMGAVVVQ
jgi:hypothetical protein